MAFVGYARVSSVGQSLDVQLDKLEHCDKIFQEKHSGTSGTRPRLHDCLEYVREGDTLVVSRLDRLARSTLHLCHIADVLARKGVHLQVLDQHIDTSDATGRLLFNMLGAIGQFETEIRAGVALKLTPAIRSRLGFYRVFGAARHQQIQKFQNLSKLEKQTHHPELGRAGSSLFNPCIINVLWGMQRLSRFVSMRRTPF
jgi:hypothetical protein